VKAGEDTPAGFLDDAGASMSRKDAAEWLRVNQPAVYGRFSEVNVFMAEEIKSPNESQGQYQYLKDFLFKNMGQTFAVIVSSIYISGFIVVTAYLGSYGLRDYEAFRIQYLIAGIILWLYFGAFVYFLGKKIHNLGSNEHSFHNLFKQYGYTGASWELWALILSLIELVYYSIMCSIVAISIMLENIFTVEFRMYLAAFMLGQTILFNIHHSSVRDKISKASFVLLGIYWTVAVVGYFIVSERTSIWIAGIYIILMAIVSLAVLEYKQHKNISIAIYMFIWALVSISGMFGSHCYSNIRPSLGGGASIEVSLVLNGKQTIPQELVKVLGLKNHTSTRVNLLAETNNELLIGVDKMFDKYKEIIRIKKEIIQAIIIRERASK